jgi:hypothetical protein
MDKFGFYMRRIESTRAHIRAMVALEGFTPYVRSLLASHSFWIQRANQFAQGE